MAKLTADNNLAAVNPELAAQWHPSGNGDLTPEDVMPKSGKKAWWQCGRGHEWQTRIASRSDGNGCPICSGRQVGDDNNLEAINHALAAQWHPARNGGLTPRQVTSGSGKRVWWKCNEGHEWQAVVAHRSRGNGCPVCAGHQVGKDNNLAAINPALAAQWHPSRNAGVVPQELMPGSGKKAWWICAEGHEWEAVVAKRSGRGDGCPLCSGQQVGEDNNLAAINSELAAQWHPSKNGDLTPRQSMPGSSKKAWWICAEGHEWQAKITNRSNGSRCPVCAGKKAGEDNNLKVVNPDLAAQWHPSKNGDLTPEQVMPGAGKRVWWTCARGHEWQSLVAQRSGRGDGCPLCSGQQVGADNNLEAINPRLAAQWHPSRNGDLAPHQVTSGSARRPWWQCPEGHEWEAEIKQRSSGSGCPQCSEHGFSPYLPSLVYLIIKPDGVIKIGITAAGRAASNRLSAHRRSGYHETVRTWDLDTGTEAAAVEKVVLEYWRESLKLPPAAPRGEHGWTETVQSTPELIKKTVGLVQSQLDH